MDDDDYIRSVLSEPVDLLSPEGESNQPAVNFSEKVQEDNFVGGGARPGDRGAKIDSETPRENSLQFKTLLEIVKDEHAAEDLYQKIKALGEGEFKESKARDTNGELMIVWHGSPRIFEQFDTNAQGEFRWRNQGIHFQSSKDLIKQYAEKAKKSLNQVVHGIGKEEFGHQEYDPLKKEHLQKAVESYNEVVRDLIANGKESKFYKRRHVLEGFSKGAESINYKEERFALESFAEIFGGNLPSEENTEMVKGPKGVEFYMGRNMGKVYYAAVLNMTRPFELETTDIDNGYEQGEESNKNSGTDGTILHHPTDLIGMGAQEVEGTAGTYSYGVFDPKDIKIIGREVNGVFEVMPEFSSQQIQPSQRPSA